MSDSHLEKLTAGTKVCVREGEWGNGVYSTTDLEKGDIIWKEKVQFLGYSGTRANNNGEGTGEVCDHCFKMTAAYEGPKIAPALPVGCDSGFMAESINEKSQLNKTQPITCEHCNSQWYCSLECKQSAWNCYHSALCGPKFTKFLSDYVDTAADVSSLKKIKQRILVIKMLLTYKSSESTFASEHIDNLVSLPPDAEDSPLNMSDEQVIWDKEIHNRLLDCLSTSFNKDNFPYSLYYTMLDKMKTNAVELNLSLKLCDGEQAVNHSCHSASGLFALQSYVNHSCNPNSHRVFFDGHLHFICVRPIKKDEQLVMAYVNPANSITDRQKKLRSHWGISCVCDRCKADLVKLVMFRKLMAGLKAKADSKKADPAVTHEEDAG